MGKPRRLNRTAYVGASNNVNANKYCIYIEYHGKTHSAILEELRYFLYGYHMNEVAFTKICGLFDALSIPYQACVHEICRTSEESARVRKAAGLPDAIGAKALLCKVDWRGEVPAEFVTFVLPGTHTLDKAKLKQALPDLKQFRFATAEELINLAGVVPGCMPPFGPQVFEGIAKLYLSSQIQNFERVAFNAAKLDTSIVLLTTDYIRAAAADAIFDFSSPKQTT